MLNTLVLDLDETLIHCNLESRNNHEADFLIPVQLEDGKAKNAAIFKRPGLDAFLNVVSKMYHVVLFTSSDFKYANPVVDVVDYKNCIQKRYFRDSCIGINKKTKDLRKLGRDLKSVVIIDDLEECYRLQPDNAIKISSWHDCNKDDRELFELIPLLQLLSTVQDIPAALKILRSKPNIMSC